MHAGGRLDDKQHTLTTSFQIKTLEQDYSSDHVMPKMSKQSWIYVCVNSVSSPKALRTG